MNALGDTTVEEGAKTSVDLATLPAGGYIGKFIYVGNELPWQDSKNIKITGRRSLSLGNFNFQK